MDVTCDRCRTEYEFDDALVSERGTTVKCTNCGYQFKVRRGDGTALPERWLVRTVDGRELEFTALRELQAAIAQTRITKDDVLSRGGSRPRRLGSIAELEPFFVNAQTSIAGTPARMGIAAPRTEASVAIPLPIAPPGFEDRPRTSQAIIAPAPDSRPRRERVATLPGVIVSPDQAPPPPGVIAGRSALVPDAPMGIDANARTMPSHTSASAPPIARSPNDLMAPATDADTFVRGGANGGQGVAVGSSEPPTIPRGARSSDPPPALGRRNVSDPPPMTPTPTDVRASYAHEDSLFGEPRFSSLRPSLRGGTARWIAAFVAIGLAAFIALSLGRKYFGSGAHANTPGGASDERIAGFVRDGEKSLAEGDVESAKEQFAKASALGDADPRVLSSVARVAVVEAEVEWLHVRLVPDSDPELVVLKKRLDPKVDRALRTSQRALEALPNDPAVIRSRIDALRISGDRAAARSLVDRIKATTSLPETQLVLAALELTEDKPDWGTAIGRLRAAANAEQDLGRARALLVFALARSGDFGAARAETDRLAELRRPHPLVLPLRAFVARTEKGDGAIDVASLPDSQAHDKAPPPAAPKEHTEPAAPKREASSTAARPRPAKGDKLKGPDGRVPDDFVAPGQQVDTSDLPGKSEKAPAPTAAPAAPADTSDMPGGKK